MAENPTAGGQQSAFLGDIPIDPSDVLDLFKRSVTVTVFNRTNETLTLDGFSSDDAPPHTGSFKDLPAPDIAPGKDDTFTYGKGLNLEDVDLEGFVRYRIGATDSNWTIEFGHPLIGSVSCTGTVTPPVPGFDSQELVGEGDAAPINVILRQDGFDPANPGGGAAVTSRCIITVTNNTESVLTLADQGHDPDRGGFFTFPKLTLQPGESDNFASVETQGENRPERQGSKGFLVYAIAGGGTWTMTWDNPERAQNTSSTFVSDVPEGVVFTPLDQIGEGEDNVPVVFTLSGGPQGGGPETDVEWAPPVEREQPTLRFGDDNPDGWVEYLQGLLNERLGTSLALDGDFGAGTLAAVKRVQQDMDIKVDGVVGFQTWAVLRNEDPARASTDNLPPHSFVESGAEARWRSEGANASSYDPATDVLTLRVVSVGDTRIDDFLATVRFIGNDTGEMVVAEAVLGPPIQLFEGGGGEYQVVADGLRAGFGPGLHTVEAYLQAELGGDYITFQVQVDEEAS